MLIDPGSPRENGVDVDGVPRELGDTDSMGTFVGYIDEGGCCWESHRERDEAITAGRFIEAWHRWNKTGGIVGPEPDPDEFAERLAHPLNWCEAAKAARGAAEDFLPGGVFNHASRARFGFIASMN